MGTTMNDRSELREFRRWVEGLSWDELQCALEFPIDADNSNEDRLLLSMAKMQAPLPNVIHPKVLRPQRFPSASSGGVWEDDGQNSIHRVARERLRRPRMFQWFETGRTTRVLVPRTSTFLASASSHHHRNHHRHPNRLRGEGRNGRSKLLPVYDVIARRVMVNGVEVDGGMACTDDQRDADAIVLCQSVVLEDPVVHRTQSGVLEHKRFVRYGYARGDQVGADADRAVMPLEVLRHLWVASRGNFMASWPPGNWLDPTDRWFSLSMYLSCRYERSLGQHYIASRTDTHALQLSPFRWKTPPESLPPPEVLRSMIRLSTARTMSDLLKADRRELIEVTTTQSAFPSRLGVEFLLEHPMRLIGDMNIHILEQLHNGESATVLLDRLLVCSLVLLGTPVDELRRGTCRTLQDTLVSYSQQQLESSLLDPGVEHATAAPPTKRGSKKTNHKRGKKRSKSQPSVAEDTPGGIDPQIEDEVGVDDQRASIKTSTVRFPENATSQRDRNRNTVLCLSILHDVLNAAFDSIGLEPDVDDFDQLDNSAKAASALDSGYENEGSPLEGHVFIPAQNGVEPHSTGTRSSLSVVDECLDDSSDVESGEDQELNHSADREDINGMHGESQYENPSTEEINEDRASDTLRRSSFVLESFGAHYATIGGAFYHRPEPGFVWEMNDDDWGRIQGLQPREQSLLADFFASGGGKIRDGAMEDKRDIHVASSTAASVDSRSEQAEGDDEILAIDADVPVGVDESGSNVFPQQMTASKGPGEATQHHPSSPALGSEGVEKFDSRSPSPQAPSTPSPTLSPILVSLADLKSLNQDSLKLTHTSPEGSEAATARSFFPGSASSLPNSPHSRPIAISLSRDDLRSTAAQESANQKVSPPSGLHLPSGRRSKSRDDQDLVLRRPFLQKRSTDALSSYRHPSKLLKARDDHDIKHHNSVRSADALLTSRPRVAASHSAFSPAGQPTPDVTLRPSPSTSAPESFARQQSRQYSRSEIDAEAQDDPIHHQTSLRAPSHDDGDNHTVTKDGSTTITSLSHREIEELAGLREERNVFRDLCLTLGAEVAKLKNLLAAQRGMTSAPRQMNHFGVPQNFPDASFFGPETVSNPFSLVSKARTMAAMSDAGYKGDHESLASEDEAGGRHMNLDGSRPTFGSEVSIDHTNSQSNVLQTPRVVPQPREFAAMAFHGTQSRLAAEVLRFVESINSQLRKQEPKRRQAVDRMTRLVNTVWPRAQVKLYGSHVTGLCLPSSDLDFVIRLPEVHKRAIAVAPGALEGRNAINESSQKQLARKLKGESWIDPRSMKLIERTVVPVIKVATKDTKAKTLQLDITFDCPGHHGMDALQMVAELMDELPMIRPLVLVLKQFLLERGLLTSYTGGLSSYCLFLMVARYLQEQLSAYGDGGSLLLGFLDFYGNYVRDGLPTALCVGITRISRITHSSSCTTV
jgi:Nucleotidyltransferase domain